jgi:hypothetical protein
MKGGTGMRQRWWFASLMLIGAVMLWQWGRTQMEASLLAERAKVRWTKVPKKVLAFYYGWYGNPKVSGRWVHWHEVDETNKRIGNSTHYPQLGPYDSHDPKVIEQHCRWAKEAGIDGFIVSWWQPNDFHDQGLPLLLDTAQRFGLEVTAYFETVPNNDRTKALSDVLYLLERYGKHPAWLKLDGKPVLFVYGRAIGQIGLNGWLWVIGEVHRRYEGGAIFIGDQISRRAARIFDGIHTYNITGATQGKSADEIFAWAQKVFPKWVATAGDGRIACLTIIPRLRRQQTARPKTAPTDHRAAWRANLSRFVGGSVASQPRLGVNHELERVARRERDRAVGGTWGSGVEDDGGVCAQVQTPSAPNDSPAPVGNFGGGTGAIAQSIGALQHRPVARRRLGRGLVAFGVGRKSASAFVGANR